MACSNTVSDIINKMEAEVDVSDEKVAHLQNLDFFILDNSIRESTVGQLRSHTIENKKKIYALSKKCEMHSIIVASFSHMHRVDDEFCQWLVDTGEDFSKLFSFSEIVGGVVKLPDGKKIPDTECVPIAIEKNEYYKLYNTFFEVDLADDSIAWGEKWTVADMCALIQKWMFRVYKINDKARILINFRDLPTAMTKYPERILSVVEFLAKMPADKRMFALAYEDPMGESLPDELAAWTRAIRSVMDNCGWKDGRLLNHIHEKWEQQTASTMECLAAGGDGVWASLCVEGAAMGHASSTVTLMNLIRLGNTKVLDTYDCKEFRKAAIEATKLTTTKMPHPKQCVYGERALDLVFGFLGVGQNVHNEKFNLADFFGERTENRMTTLVTEQMVVDRLTFLFGSDPQFTLDMGKKMKEKMLEDLNAVPPRKEEYQSAMGLAVLFDRSGGQLTEKMSQAIANVKLHDVHHKRFIEEIRALWDFWDSNEESKNDGCLDFDSFYHGFLASYFGCYRCAQTEKALKCMDMDKDGYVDWNEFLVYIKWALAEYPDTTDADTVVEIALQKGLLPGMRDVKLDNPEMQSGAAREERRAARKVRRAARAGNA